MSIEKYHRWKNENGLPFVPVAMEGIDLLQNSILNKGTAFDEREREEFRLQGLLPPHISTMDEQLDRVYEGFSNNADAISKYQYLRGLQDRNVTLFYRLVDRHIEEMAPIIYTPTVGEACRQFSHRFRRTRGLYITKSNVSMIGEMIHHFPSRGVQVIVVTDNQGILGIGDQGIGGMGIPIGKLSLYTLGAGIHPAACLPITLDVGTDNEDCLSDPLYLGEKHHRMTGGEYNDFISKFVSGIKANFPNAVLQWEDFSKNNAFYNLERYRESLSSFNDDIQGTGAVCLAGIYTALSFTGRGLKDESFVVYGAGAGGGGIAYQIRDALVDEGLSAEEALKQIFVFDSKGLIMDNRKLDEYKQPFAKPAEKYISNGKKQAGQVSLKELLDNQRVTVLIGASTHTGAFDEEVVRIMLRHCDRPLIFPLSNPHSKCEAKPDDLYKWSEGRAIIATGSPFEDVSFDGKSFRVGQGNNVFIFPAVGLAAVIGRFGTFPPWLFLSAAKALSELIPKEDFEMGAIYPRIGELRKVSRHVCMRLLERQRLERGEKVSEDEILSEIRATMWKPVYMPYRRV
ncbi:MAG: NAD-dependent malic enzyme [Deltaproteobacteria bacterium]|nr:NAD-dependent malic enzyme [Deltaproteobacteria bacterium]